ncbi:YggS family pyridoxal phosphate-dependent enzyme [Motiliproteus sediminis]|uniref:YggS family pyridoxal phosphate-dependent enzyme n=1 Tax=Motiliproteus sediminis TaxID=1468178 RepID=UPI001AEFB331|nr:YggS family pyridoxal phosphate-dependent enzyme [Motiliproteus sediminis]
MASIVENIQRTLTRIREAEDHAGRAPGSVKLLAVSKTRSPDEVREAHSAGLRAFGENYLQDAMTKVEALADLTLEWHFIGPLQSNKTRAVASHFDWVHSVDRLKIAQRLSDQRAPERAPLNLCIQVNISAEGSKSGVAADEVYALAQQILPLPNVALRGLMAIPAADLSEAEQHQAFARMQRLLEQIQPLSPGIDTLSMGMSDDLEAAVAEGATMVRIGTALFGPRRPLN